MTFSSAFHELFHDDLLSARRVFLTCGHDPMMDPAFWETWVAEVTGGRTTDHKCHHDIVAEGARSFRFEVKFSRAFSATFGGVPRPVFKWRVSDQQINDPQTDALVLVGVCDERVWTWACRPIDARPSMTVTVPFARKGSPRGSTFDAFVVPAGDLLPALMRLCHLTYDAPLHARNAARTRRQRAGVVDLFD